MRYARVQDRSRLSVDGIRFDSLAEVEAYAGFKLLEKAGEISKLKYHTKFEFFIPDYSSAEPVYIGSYEADFTYLDKHKKPHVIEIKGWTRTRRGELKPRLEEAFQIKRNLMLACFGIQVEVL